MAVDPLPHLTRGPNTKTVVLYSVAIACAIGAVAAFFFWIWPKAGLEDAAPGRHELTKQLMRRKALALSDLQEGLSTKNYSQIQRGIKQLSDVNATASWYLSDNRYSNHGEEFLKALDEFEVSVGRRDLNLAAERLAAIEASCNACHKATGAFSQDADSMLIE